MNCEKCGQDIDAIVCPTCGVTTKLPSASQVGVYDYSMYLIGTSLASIFCCNPVTLASLAFAIIANKKSIAGDVDGAKNASKIALYCMIGGIAFGFVFALIYVIFQMVVSR